MSERKEQHARGIPSKLSAIRGSAGHLQLNFRCPLSNHPSAGYALALIATSMAGAPSSAQEAGPGTDVGAVNQYWDGSDITADSMVDGGSGIWSLLTTNTNWTNNTGQANSRWSNGNTAVFQASPGNVMVDGTNGMISVNGGLQFLIDGYSISGSPLSTTTGSALIRVGDASSSTSSFTAAIDSIISGTGGINKDGSGTLILTAGNTFTGVSTISGGTLSISTSSSLGNGSTWTLAGTSSTASRLLFTADGSLAKRGTLTSGRFGTLEAAAGTALTVTAPSTTAQGGALNVGNGGGLDVVGDIDFVGNQTTASGGAIFVTGSTGSLNLRGDVDFSLNTSQIMGGAIYAVGPLALDGGASDIDLVTNTASANGGAFYSTNTNTMSFTASGGSLAIQGNSGRQGGALFGGRISIDGDYRSILIDGNTGTYTRHTDNAGTLNYGGGGGIYAYETLLINNTAAGGGTLTITNNRSGADGGAVLAHHGLTFSGNYTDIILENNTSQIGTSSRGMGGALRVTDGPLLIDSTTTGSLLMRNNVAATFGGALDAAYDNSTITLRGSYGSISLTGNQAVLNGGGALGAGNDMLIDATTPGIFDISGNTAKTSGGALLGYFEDVTVSGSYGQLTFDANSVTATTGTGVSGGWGGAIYTEKALLVNPMVAGDLTFSNNRASMQGGALASGNGIGRDGVMGSVTMEGSSQRLVFSGNAAAGVGLGGAIYTGGLLTLGGTHGSILVSDNTSSGRGGAFYAGGGFSLSLGPGASLSATGNSASSGGGFLFTNGGSAVFDIGAGATATIGNGTSIVNATDSIGAASNVPLIKRGAGALSLWGANTYTGATNVDAGVLALNGSSRSNVTVSADATLGGIGTTTGSINVLDGGHLGPGTSAGTLTAASLTLAPGSVLDFELGPSGIIGGGVNDLLQLTGALTLDGTLNVADLGGFGTGIYRLINHGGVLTDRGLQIGTTPAGFAAADILVHTLTSGQVNLLVQAGGFATQFWDGPNYVGNGSVDGGTATWNNLSSNWTGADGLLDAPWQGDRFAVFQGLAGTVSVDNGANAVTFSGARFAVDGYIIQGQPLTTTSARTDIAVGNGTPTGAAMTATIGAVILGSGGVDKTDDGTLIFTADNHYTGGTTISGGTLRLGDGGTSGGVSGDIVNDSSLAFDRGDSVLYSGVISGSGTLSQLGAGRLTLTGAHSFTGATDVSAGELRVNGALVSEVNVQGGATLSGSGQVGNVTLADDASVAPGDGVGTLTFGDFLLSANSHLEFELGLPNRVGGLDNDLLQVNGDLRLDGILDITDFGGFGTSESGDLDGGVYRLINYSGQLTDNLLTLGSLPSTFDPGDFLIQTASPGQVNLIVSAGGFVHQFWDGTQTVGDGLIAGGDGTWLNLLPNNWTNANGTVNAPWQPGFAIFQGSAGTVVLGENIDTSGMQFVTDGYRLTAGSSAFELRGEPSMTIRLDAGISATIDAPIADASGAVTSLVKTGTGTLNLAGSNSYSGGTRVTGGFLQVATDANLGAASGSLALDNGVLHATGSFVANRPVTLGTGDGTFAIDSGIAVTLAGAVGGDGALIKRGDGILALVASNSYEGGTRVAEGVLLVDADDRLGASSSALRFDGGTLRLAASFDINAARSIALGVRNGTLDTQEFDTVISQPVAGLGGLIKLGSGALTLAADNAYAGDTSVAAGTLRLGAGGATGSVRGNIVNEGAVIFDHSADVEYAGVISGGGSLTQQGGGELRFTADQTYAGPTTIQAGSLALGDGGTAGMIAGNVANAGALIFQRSDDVAFAGVVSGSGTLYQRGAGILTLTADNSYAGGTRIEAGTLQIGDGGTRGSVAGDVIDDGMLVFNRSNDMAFAGVISGSGGLRKLGAGTLTLTADHSYSGGTHIEAGRLVLGNGGSSGMIAGDVVNDAALVFDSSADTFFEGLISGNGTVTQQGMGVLTFTADHTYSGLTRISAGTLRLGNGGIGGSVAGDILDNGALVFDRADDFLFAGSLSGAGTLTKHGAGTLVLAGSASHAGGTLVEDGVLQVGTGGTTGSLGGGVVNHAMLAFNRADDVVYAGVISGTGALVQRGTGRLVLQADQAYSGITTIESGTLQLGNGGSGGSVTGDVINDGTLVFDRGSDLAYGGGIAGSGSVVKNGSNTLALTGMNTYSGDTLVAAGTLRIDGRLESAVNVGPVARLLGTGQVGALFNAGVVSPGNSIGTLSVAGNFEQSATGELLIEFDDQGNFDTLGVGGGATLAGQVTYLPDSSSTFSTALTYTYLPTRTGVTGTFENPTQEYAGVVFQTFFQPTEVQLQITPVSLPDNLTPQAEGLEACLSSLEQRRNTLDGEAARQMNSLILTPTDSLDVTVQGICARDPEILPAALDSQLYARTNLVAGRIADVRAVRGPDGEILDAYETRQGRGLWMRGSYVEGRQSARGLLRSGYDSKDRGFTLGMDGAVGSNAVIGGYLARSDMDLTYRATAAAGGGQGGRTEDEGWSLGAYSSYWSDRHWFVHGIVEYGWHELDSSRNVTLGGADYVATGSRDAKSLAASTGTGFNLMSGQRLWIVQPQLLFTYHRLADEGYAEDGVGALDLTYSQVNSDTLRSEAGVSVRRIFVRDSDAVSVGAFYLYANFVYDDPLDSRDVTASFAIGDPFVTAGEGKAREGIHYGAGFEYTFRGNSSLQLLLDAQSYSEIETASASLQYRKQF